MGREADKTQVNVRLERELVAEIDELVRSGRFSSKTEAFSEALRLLMRAHKGEELARLLDEIREGTGAYPSLTDALAASREEEEGPLG
jgi:Arc/MetJ-type ribon-helix-helix transcriptional regulator